MTASVAVLDPHFPNGDVTGVFRNNGRRMILTREFVFVDGDLRVTVPEGFDTDFNSVPRGLWNLFPPWECPEAGVAHDALYQSPGAFSRADCDAVHRRIMEICGESKTRRTLVWLGIRVGGWAPWGEYRRREHPETAA
jgi:hypothetical protein